MSDFQPRTFTIPYHQSVKSIKTTGTIINPDNNMIYQSQNFIWDTGATISVLNTHIIQKLNLVETSIKTIRTASDATQCFDYYIDIVLHNEMKFKKLLVSGLPLEKETDALIGMDIIGKGSFLFETDPKTKEHTFTFSIGAGI